MSRVRPSLLNLLAADLAGYQREDTPKGSLFTPSGSGKPLDVSVRVERRFLGRTEVARFNISSPASSSRAAKLRIRHTGLRRRAGIEVLIDQGDHAASALAAAIEGDQGLVDAVLPLDFKRFDLVCEGGRWHASVELMGASLVAIALPPMRSYIRLYPDQRNALVETLAALERILMASG